MKGAAGMMGGTKLDAIFGVADGNPVTAAGDGTPSLEAWQNFTNVHLFIVSRRFLFKSVIRHALYSIMRYPAYDPRFSRLVSSYDKCVCTRRIGRNATREEQARSLMIITITCIIIVILIIVACYYV